MARLIDADALKLEFMENGDDHAGYEIHQVIDKAPTVDAVPVVRCKDCKHRPTKPRNFNPANGGFDIEFPDDECPCQCDDGWYSWYPADDFFCARGERKGGAE